MDYANPFIAIKMRVGIGIVGDTVGGPSRVPNPDRPFQRKSDAVSAAEILPCCL